MLHAKLQSMQLFNYQRLITDESCLTWSMSALRFAVFSDCVNGMILQPNYAIMVDQNAHEESFPSTAPFDFASATYFIPMTSLLGVAIISTATGAISDRIGRKPVMLFCLGGSMLGSIAKWLCRESFWAFCIANFFNGLVSGSLPVALAYVSDIFTERKTKEKEFTKLVGFWVLGQSVGGIVAILMYAQGLFAPLWVGVGIMLVACCITYQFLIEPGELTIPTSLNDIDEDLNEDLNANLPDEIDKVTMTHIIIGAFADTIGSKALFPICLAPLAFNTFYKDFITNNQNPILSLSGYQWLTVLTAFLVIPSALLTPGVFRKIGLASTCVIGNVITGALTIVLLFIANVEPPTYSTFIGFVATMYVGYPFTVMSQLSTSPMLDRIAPLDKRGFVQGTYTTFLNMGNAIAPWMLGLLADATTVDITIWTGVAISFFAAIINSPLMLRKCFGPARPEGIFKEMTVSDEDEDMWEEKLANGEYIPADILSAINFKRIREKKYSLLVPRVGRYEHDKSTLHLLRRQAKDDFTFLRNRSHNLLSKINEPEMPQFVQDVNEAIISSMSDTQHDIGVWFAEYMKDSGYIGTGSPQTIKLMILKAFPVLFEEGRLSLDNFEQGLVNSERVYNHYLKQEIEKEKEYGYLSIFRRPLRRFHG
jgi:MFS family permease